jgi:tRNA (adenine22-N1)-methyltransferase
MEQGIIPSGIAMDINEGPLKRARENISRYGFSDRLETRLSDGAKELKAGEADTILISGMGGGLTIKILSESQSVVNTAKELVLQPQSDLCGVRHYLHRTGFRIENEFMLLEDGKNYTGIRTVPGKERYEKEIFYRYGKLLLEERNPVLKEFLLYGKNSFEKVTKELKEQTYDRNKVRLSELLCELSYIKEALDYYT